MPIQSPRAARALMRTAQVNKGKEAEVMPNSYEELLIRHRRGREVTP